MPIRKKYIEPSILFDYADSIFDEGASIKITVTGDSMYPFLRNKVDSVEIHRVSYCDVKVSDIVLAKKGDIYLLHRVIKKNENEFYMTGDSQIALDGPYTKDMLIGKVLTIYRKDKIISCSSIPLRILVRLWMIVRPLRFIIIRGYFSLRNRRDSKKAGRG